jgi:hypothetical protein
MIKVLTKAIVKPFYEAHTGFFLVLLFFAGGFMRAQEHIMIAKFIAGSDFLTFILVSLFLLYQLKASLFTKKLFQKQHYRFVRNLTFLSPIRQVVLLSIIVMSMNGIVLVYGFFVSRYMLEIEVYNRLIILGAYFLLSLTLSTWVMMRQLKRPIIEQKNGAIIQLSNRILWKPYVLWFVIHVLKNRPALFLLSKVLSISLLIGCFSAYDPELYDWRFLGVGTVFAMTANLMLAHEYFNFHAVQLTYFRNLPTSIVNRVSISLVSILLLLTPEVVVVFRHIPIEVSYYFSIQIILYGLVSGLFYYHLMLYKSATTEQLGKACFYMTMIQAFLVLFGLPLYILCITMFAFIFNVQFQYYQLHDY